MGFSEVFAVVLLRKHVLLITIFTLIGVPVGSYAAWFTASEYEENLGRKVRDVTGTLERAFLVTDREISSKTSYDPIFRDGWVLKAGYMNTPVRVGRGIRHSVVYNFTKVKHGANRLVFERATRLFVVQIEPVQGGDQVRILECQAPGWTNSMKFQVARDGLTEAQVRDSLPGVFKIARMFLGGEFKKIVKAPGEFIESALKLKLSEEEMQISKEYSEWYSPLYPVFVEDEGQFQDPCSSSGQYVEIEPESIARF